MKQPRRNQDDQANAENFSLYISWLDAPLVKKSGKPFKSGEKVGKAVDVVMHEHLYETLAFLMDDGSKVRCSYCIKVNDE